MVVAQVDESRIGRAAFLGGIIGFAVFGALVGGMLLALGAGAASWGAAVFVGMFSGVGFGSMIAAMLQGDREG